jgi:adenine-specific DNA-methyltransferase
LARKPKAPKKVETLNHEASRKNIPTAELQALNERLEDDQPFEPVSYPRARPLAEGETRERDGDLDPQIIWNGMRITLTEGQRKQLQETGKVEIGDAQLTWRGKDRQDWSDLVVNVPPIYVQEKVHPKALIDDLVKRTKAKDEEDAPDLFGDFNGIDAEARTEFYEHDQHWSNRMILGDSLQVMASLAERERLRGKVQAIYFDPPYGIKFNSNWQVSTRSRDVKDGKLDSVTREPEQVKAFRDTWKDGIHSYLTYLRDRLTVMRDLLTESGSIFVQIGDENVHRVRAVMDEVFGEENFLSEITVQKTYGFSDAAVSNVCDYIVWYCKNKPAAKIRPLFSRKRFELGSGNATWLQLPDFQSRGVSADEKRGRSSIPDGAKPYNPDNLISQGAASDSQEFSYRGLSLDPRKVNSHWKPSFPDGMDRLRYADRVHVAANSFRYRRYHTDFDVAPYSNIWTDTGTGNFTDEKLYVVQTGSKTVERCLLMATDPGDLVLDPTCGSGTTATVAEQWGRRWITIDTSRVALALARQRLMSAKYPYYFLKDSPEGLDKEADITGKPPSTKKTEGDLRQGFVYERAPHITLKSIANNTEIDTIWETSQETLEPLREKLNAALGETWEEWEIPREADEGWPKGARDLHEQWWEARIERQKEIDQSIARAADVEYLYDRPYEDKARVRVAGPFTVESLSPHRVVPMDDEDFLADEKPGKKKRKSALADGADFVQVILENLRTSGVQQGDKDLRITFDELSPWPGEYVNAEGRFEDEKGTEKRAGIMVGPEYGTLDRGAIVRAAREAAESRFDLLIVCAFGFDAHSTELNRLAAMPIIKAKMNPDLHMAEDLRRDKNANLFMVIGEPDIQVHDHGEEISVQIFGMDVFVPATGEIRHGNTKDVAAWFIDTDYNEESFFVRHAYFLGEGDPYKSLKTALKAEVDQDAWETLYRDTSRRFVRPENGRIAVKVINHFGDEVMKVVSV